MIIWTEKTNNPVTDFLPNPVVLVPANSSEKSSLSTCRVPFCPQPISSIMQARNCEGYDNPQGADKGMLQGENRLLFLRSGHLFLIPVCSKGMLGLTDKLSHHSASSNLANVPAKSGALPPYSYLFLIRGTKNTSDQITVLSNHILRIKLLHLRTDSF